jgi:cyclophilin family peptidyl-prolyl cis-trans isomerase
MRRFLFGLGLAALLAGCGATDATSQPTVQPRPTSAPEAVATVQPTAASGSQNPGAGALQFANEPELTIDVNKAYTATLKTEKGDIVIALAAKYAPRTVNSFVFLARQGFYDNVTFHRVIPGFVAQTGDPTGTGAGGPGYEFPNEYDPASGFNYKKAGVVGMANAGPNTNGSQFFISYKSIDLDPATYTVFGQVVAGQDVLEQITPRDPGSATTPGDTLLTVVIEESGS